LCAVSEEEHGSVASLRRSLRADPPRSSGPSPIFLPGHEGAVSQHASNVSELPQRQWSMYDKR
jgi:hypothetical protein